MTDPLEDHLAGLLRARATGATISADAYPRIVARGARARRLSLLAASATVVVVAVAALAVPVVLEGRAGEFVVGMALPSPSASTEPTPSPAPDVPPPVGPSPPPSQKPSPAVPVEGAWLRADDDTAFGRGERAVDVVEFRGGAVAVGAVAVGVDDPAFLGSLLSNPAVWVSDDGRRWSQLPHDDALFGEIPDEPPAEVSVRPPFEMAGVAAGDDAVVAVGWAEGRAAAWWSQDGRAWNLVPLPGQGAAATDLEYTGDRFVALGSGERTGEEFFGRPMLWTSSDGRTWDQEPLDADWEAHDLVLAGDRLLIPDGRDVLVSDDGGRNFARHTASGLDLVEGLPVVFAGLPDGSYWAVSRTVEYLPDGSGRDHLVAYTSEDGVTWQQRGELPAPGPNGMFVNGLTNLDDGTLVAVGHDFGNDLGTGDYDNARVWTSSDGGGTWVETADPNGVFDEATYLHAVARVGDSLVALGAHGRPSDYLEGAVWVLPR